MGEIININYKSLIGLLIISSMLLFSGCVNSNNANTEIDNINNTTYTTTEISLSMAGGTAVVPIAQETAKIFMKSHPNVKIEVIGGGSGFGINEIGEKRIDIGMAGRNIKSSEKEKYPNLIASKIAVDGVAIVINKENPINNLTTEQLQKIYSKTITNWKEVGGTDEPITVYTRDELSGTRDTFWKLALNKNNISDRALIVASNGEMKAKVSADKNGIGYISVGYIDESVKPVALDGVNPTKENIKKGDYKVYRPLILITNGEPEPTVKEYINYILSPEGQKIVESKGFLSIN